MTTPNRFILIALVFSPLAAIAQSPAGTWKMSVPDETGKMMSLTVNIHDNGTYGVDYGSDGTVETKGKYTVDKDQMTIQDTEGSDCLAPGVYKFVVEGNTFTMTRISEGCTNRGGPEGVMKMERG